jgi:hypothetical protein
VDVRDLETPATLWYATSGSRVALGSCEAPGTRIVRDGLVADKWWRLELRAGSAPMGDILTLVNPVWVSPTEA